MNYEIDELYSFYEYDNANIVKKYLPKNDPSVTEVEIPEECNGKPVVEIWHEAFAHANYLKSVKLPKCLKAIRCGAFCNCPELERVELNSAPIIERNVFNGCPKLPAETVVMGLVGSTDITRPLPALVFGFLDNLRALNGLAALDNAAELPNDCFRPDVFELLVKNDSFRDFGLERALYKIIDNNKPELFSIAEQYGMLDNAELLDRLMNYSIEQKKTELTAYLLELKKRKFGFDGGNDIEL